MGKYLIADKNILTDKNINVKIFPKSKNLYEEGAVVIEEEGNPKRVLSIAEYDAEKKAKNKAAEKLKYDSDK